MASVSVGLLSFYLFLSFTPVVPVENITSQIFNTTTFGNYNFTYNFTDSDNTQPTEFGLTTTTPSYTNTEPVQSTQPAEPLAVSGRLPTPVNEVYRLCPCNEVKDVCDINCCCDPDCSDEVALFTDCSVSTISGNKQFCSHDVASYTLGSTAGGYSELQSSVQKETNYNIFCIQSQNRIDGFSHPSPALPTDSNFDLLFEQYTSFLFSSKDSSGQVSIAKSQASYGYKYGDMMVTAGENVQKGVFLLPAAGVTAECVDTSPAAFLKDQRSQCSRRMVLDQDCNNLQALNIDVYTNIHLFAGKNKDAAVVPVQVASAILQSVNGTQTELNISRGETLTPTLLNPDLCANVVLKVVYVIKWNASGEIVNATVSFVLGFVHGASLPLQQEFQLSFVQHDSEEVAVHYSGNPGYVVGLPLVSGTRTTDGIVRSIDLRDTLSLVHNAEDQDCLRGPHQRSPVLFGVDFVSGCTLRLEDAANCSLISQVLLDVLRGPNYPPYVASFGNSPLSYLLDWVQIQTIFIPEAAQTCSIPLSLHLEIEWTKYGALVNPQPQILSIKELIHTNTTSLGLLSGGNGFLSIRNSVAFKSVSAAASPGFRAMPTINAKLPYDFFFPFV